MVAVAVNAPGWRSRKEGAAGASPCEMEGACRVVCAVCGVCAVCVRVGARESLPSMNGSSRKRTRAIRFPARQLEFACVETAGRAFKFRSWAPHAGHFDATQLGFSVSFYD